MEFALTPEQEEMRRTALRVARSFDNEYWQKIDSESVFPRAYWDAVVKHGFTGVAVDAAYGGSGLGLLDLAICVEALSNSPAGMGGGGIFVAGPVFGGFLIGKHGTPAQKGRFLPGIAAGDLWAGAFTEANSGSNISDIKTVATETDAGYRIRGQKMFISNIAVAKHIAIYARTAPRSAEQKTHGVTLFVTDLPNPRITGKPFKKLGSHWMDTNAVFLDDVEIPADGIVGVEGRGWGALYDVLNPERIILAATAIGAGLWLVEQAVRHAKERSVWGKPIGTHQGIQFPLAQAKAHLDAARLAVLESAWLYDRGDSRCGIAAAAAKYSAAHAALAAADQAIQTLGGAGYMVESGIERHWRDLRLNRIAPVSDEMALGYIAQHDLGLPRSY
jgi:acyl-CoA dehydrogenase